SAFVMDFLGNVNVFPGQVQNGRALLGHLEVEYPDYPNDESRPAAGYVRPHELEIERAAGPSRLEARVPHVKRAGPVGRVQLRALAVDRVLHVDVSPARCAELGLKVDDVVFVAPRRVRVFVPEYVI